MAEDVVLALLSRRQVIANMAMDAVLATTLRAEEMEASAVEVDSAAAMLAHVTPSREVNATVEEDASFLTTPLEVVPSPTLALPAEEAEEVTVLLVCALPSREASVNAAMLVDSLTAAATMAPVPIMVARLLEFAMLSKLVSATEETAAASFTRLETSLPTSPAGPRAVEFAMHFREVHVSVAQHADFLTPLRRMPMATPPFRMWLPSSLKWVG